MEILAFFGEPWPEERLQGLPRGATPLQRFCVHCGDRIRAGDQGLLVERLVGGSQPGQAPLHRECMAEHLPQTDGRRAV